jgi:hypothetical protein
VGDGTTNKGGICGLSATNHYARSQRDIGPTGGVAPGVPGGGHDVVFTSDGETWTNAVRQAAVHDPGLRGDGTDDWLLVLDAGKNEVWERHGHRHVHGSHERARRRRLPGHGHA